MNQVALLLALREMIVANEDTLVNGFVHQGVERSIHKVTTTVIDPPQGFYHIAIYCSLVVSASRDAGNIVTATEEPIFDCSIFVIDAALQELDEELPYEDMTHDFRTLCDRMVAMLRSTRCFSASSPNDTPKYTIVDPKHTIRVENADDNWYDNQNQAYGPILFSTIKFKVKQT